MSNKKNFICTTDPETAKTLRELGYKELPKEGNRWMFLNDEKIFFADNKAKVNYTNTLTF